KPRAKEALATGVEALAKLQDMLYAQDRWAVLLVFKPWMPPARAATSSTACPGVTPRAAQGIPSRPLRPEDPNTVFLWRCMKYVPERGRIGIFNRSYYEETLVVRVHKEILEKETLPPELITKNIWKERFQDIRSFERYLTRNGIVIRKFFLHVSNKEQKK